MDKNTNRSVSDVRLGCESSDDIKPNEELVAMNPQEASMSTAEMLEREPSSESLDATQFYLSSIGSTPLLTADQEKELGWRIRKGDEQARHRMIQSNLRLVVKISRRYVNRGLPLLDLVEEGNLGLMHAVGKFNPDLGYRFSTYATWWIRQTIERGLMNQTRTIRLPVHVVKEINACLKVSRRLTQKLNREPTLDEIAEILHKDPETIRKLIELNEPINSMSIHLGDGGDKDLDNIIADDFAVDPQEMVEQHDMQMSMQTWLAHLTERQRQVLEWRFGLNGREQVTLEQVGHAIGLTRERVRQIQMEALARLRQLLEGNGLSSHVLFG